VKALRIALLFLSVLLIFAAPVWWYMSADEKEREFNESEPDLPAISVKIDKEEYLNLRSDYVDTLRGFDTAKQDSRTKALRELDRSEAALAERRASLNMPPSSSSWRALGPAPIPVNASTSYSGRVSAIAVHPTNPNIVYVGTALGGLYRSLDGGANWTPMMDSAFSLAIGSITIAPSDPTTVFVGTGEATFSGLSFIGVGVYCISNADTTAVLTGPLNQGTGGGDIFTGRTIGRVIVHPTDPNIIFVTSASGISGIGGNNTGLVLPNAGIYRSVNAMSANPTFEQLTIQGTLAASRSVVDAATEPGNPARLLIAVIGNGGDGGVYLATNALDAVPSFTRTLATGDGSSLGRTEFAVNKTGAVVTVYAAAGTSNGTLFKSVDGGAIFNPAAGGVGFCNPQCFYDIAVAVDPGDAAKVYLGGAPTRVFSRSADSGTTFTTNSQTAQNLHVDTHAFALAPSNTNIMYFGSDGGIWKTTDVNATPIVWTSLNNGSFSATQFMGITLHPFNRNYMLGGTQDNGTQFLAPDGTTWVRSDGGDGGFAVIDKNSPTANSVTAYHTYFNQTNSQIGFSRALTTDPNGDPIWSGFLGCQGASSNNGIICSDTVRFYAPMVGGPGNPNTLYFGTNRLYRSVNRGSTMTDVSGILPATVTAIAIAPQNDDVRLVGLQNGGVFLSTTAGATTMTNITGSIPARYVGRVAIDPTNPNVAYVALNGYGLAAGQHVWKTTNLLGGAPTWSPAGSGIPDVPTNNLAIDPLNPNTLFAGTDIGVFQSTDGGANWLPFNTGLPRVPVFGMEFQPVHRVLRVATHGRGIYEYAFANPRTPYDFDGDKKSDISIYRPSPGEWWINRSSTGATVAAQFGAATDKIVPGDFTGDGKADIAFWRPSSGEWFVLRSEDGSYFSLPFGQMGDIPIPADYDNDGKTDIGIFRPSTSTWYILMSSNGTSIFQYGIAGDLPVVADYDDDGKADIAIFRPGPGEWWISRSTAGPLVFQFGAGTDKPVQGDYTGDGKADAAFFRPSTGFWFIVRSEDFSFYSVPFGTIGDVVAPGDFDGDGKFDTSIFRPSTNTWYINRTTAGTLITQFGLNGDQPIPNAYVP
jgi:hypothetical protein